MDEIFTLLSAHSHAIISTAASSIARLSIYTNNPSPNWRNNKSKTQTVCIEYWYPRGIRLTCTVVVLIEDHRLETMPWVCGWLSLGHVTVPWVKGLGWFWLKTVKYTCVNLSGDLNWLVAIGGVVIRINKRGKVRREIFGYRNVFCTKRVRQYRCLLVIN